MDLGGFTHGGPPDDPCPWCHALHPSTGPLSDSANCVVPVTRSLDLNHPNRRLLIIRGAIKETNAGSTCVPDQLSRFPNQPVPRDPSFLYFPRIFFVAFPFFATPAAPFAVHRLRFCSYECLRLGVREPLALFVRLLLCGFVF